MKNTAFTRLAIPLAFAAGFTFSQAAPDDDALHPGYIIETLLDASVAPEITGMAFLPDGRMAFSHWGGDRNRVSTSGKVVLFTPVEGDPSRKWAAKDLATGLMDPAGLAILGTGLYVGETNRISRIGLDGSRQTVAAVTTSGNNHEYNFSLVAKGGRLYATLGQAFPPAPSKDRGVLLEADPATGRLEFLAGGLREPNGLAEGPEGELFATDNQGHWVPTSKLVHLSRGRDYGFDNPLAPFGNEIPTPPAIWLPHGELFNSPGQPAYLSTGPFAGQFLIGEVCGGAIRRAFPEKVKGVWQGAVMRFIRKGITTGPLRMVQAPAGSPSGGTIWFGGLRGIAGFNCDNIPGGAKNGLHRLVPTGKTVFEIKAIRAHDRGFEIEFTRPAAAGVLATGAAYEADQFRYQPTADYGGPKLDPEKLVVTSLRSAADNRSVVLDLAGMKEGRVIHFRFKGLVSDSGQSLWQEEAWYTLNRIGKAEPTVRAIRSRDPDGPFQAGVAFQTGVGKWMGAGYLETGVEGPHRIRITDIRGRKVFEVSARGPGRIPLTGMPKVSGLGLVTVVAKGSPETGPRAMPGP